LDSVGDLPEKQLDESHLADIEEHGDTPARSVRRGGDGSSEAGERNDDEPERNDDSNLKMA
jgi:hypothetical protein